MSEIPISSTIEHTVLSPVILRVYGNGSISYVTIRYTLQPFSMGITLSSLSGTPPIFFLVYLIRSSSNQTHSLVFLRLKLRFGMVDDSLV